MSRFGIGWRVAAVAIAFAVLAPPLALANRRGRRWGRPIPVWFHRLFLALFGIRVRISGRPPGGVPTLVLANHVSWLDIPVFASLAPLSFVAKSEVAGWPVVGLFATLQRSVFIDRQRRSQTADVNAAVAHRLAGGDLMVLFAEGTTSDGNRVLPFRSALVGAARAALIRDEGLDRIHLQPLAIAYRRRNGLPLTRRERPEVAWYGDMDLAPHLAALFRHGPLDVDIAWGEPIAFDARTDRKRATAAAEMAVRAAVTRPLQAAAADASQTRHAESAIFRTPQSA